MHRAAYVPAADKYIGQVGLARPGQRLNEAEAVGMAEKGSCDKIHVVRGPVALATDFHDLSGLDEFLDGGPKLRAGPFGDFKVADDLLHLEGMIGRFS